MFSEKYFITPSIIFTQLSLLTTIATPKQREKKTKKNDHGISSVEKNLQKKPV